MQFHLLDWTILGGLFAVLLVALAYCSRLVKSTSGFLAADRCAGRYLIAISTGMANVGAISIIGAFELHHTAGFTPIWWGFMGAPIGLIISLSGYVVYRLRETRVITAPQFFELRYSKAFRVYGGFVAWFSGIVNYGIFPAVTCRFFLYYFGFPETIQILGTSVGVFPLLMAITLTLGAVFAIFGGQISIMITDFLQGVFANIAFLVILLFFLYLLDWNDIMDVLHQTTLENRSFLNPYKSSQVEDFNFSFFAIGAVLSFYVTGTWFGSQGYQVAAKSPHEAKMANILGQWRVIIQSLLLMFVPICIYTIMRSPAKFGPQIATIQQALSGLPSPEIQNQLAVSLGMAQLLPIGLIGMFAALMFAAMLSTDNTYMHSWGSILVQDVIMPLLKKPLSPKMHLLMLRLSIVFVAVFAFLFSYFFNQVEAVMLFQAISGAIFIGGAGAVMVFGLYWKRGNVYGAFASITAGAVFAIGNMVLQQVQPAWYLNELGKPIINGQWVLFGGCVVSFFSYIIFSLIGHYCFGVRDFNLDRMLHRHEYADKDAPEIVSGWRSLIPSREFTRSDRIIYYSTFVWSILWTLVFVIGTILEFYCDLSDEVWGTFWRFYLYLGTVLGGAFTVFFIFGGIKDMRYLFHELKTRKVNYADDGRIVDGRNAGEDAP